MPLGADPIAESVHGFLQIGTPSLQPLNLAQKTSDLQFVDLRCHLQVFQLSAIPSERLVGEAMPNLEVGQSLVSHRDFELDR